MKLYGMTAVLCVGVLVFQTEAYAQSRLTPQQQRHVSGFVSHELDQQRARAAATAGVHTAAVTGASLSSTPTATPYTPVNNDSCKQTIGSNVKVNQNCLNLSDPDLQGRAQAQNETAIAQDPRNFSNLVAAFNDYRRGDGTCGVAYSLDGGQHWNDSTTPNGFTRGTNFGGVARQYWQAGGDPSVAFDTKGNAYLDCQVFMGVLAPPTIPTSRAGSTSFVPPRITAPLGTSRGGRWWRTLTRAVPRCRTNHT